MSIKNFTINISATLLDFSILSEFQRYNMELFRIFLGLLPFLVIVQPQSIHSVTEPRNLGCYKRLQYGRCKGHRKMWGFVMKEQRCITFDYSNCGGNENRFHNEEDCIAACQPPVSRGVTPEYFK